MNATNSRIPDTPTDPEAELLRLNIAAGAGDSEAMCLLGYLYAERLRAPNLEAARYWYECAADAGNSTAMYNLAVLYKVRIKPRDMKTARRWLKRAAEAGFDLDGLCAGSITRRAALRVYRTGNALLRRGES